MTVEKDKILFLDIDGVFIPYRAYYLPEQTRPIVTMFDPCAVALVNDIAKGTGCKFVIHSSWLKNSFFSVYVYPEVGTVCDWMVYNGLESGHFHKDHSVSYSRPDTNRWDAISQWLSDHPTDVEDFIILDDEELSENYHNFNSVLYRTDFDEGITYSLYKSILNRWA